MMELNDLIQEKECLESDIKHAINARIEKFVEVTGVHPSNIKVKMLDVTNMEDTKKKFKISDVVIFIEI